MGAEELKKESLAEGVELQERDKREKIENPAGLLQDSLSGLDKFGGFQLLKGLIKGVDNMNPKRRAVKNIFLHACQVHGPEVGEDDIAVIALPFIVVMDVAGFLDVKILFKTIITVLKGSGR